MRITICLVSVPCVSLLIKGLRKRALRRFLRLLVGRHDGHHRGFRCLLWKEISGLSGAHHGHSFVYDDDDDDGRQPDEEHINNNSISWREGWSSRDLSFPLRLLLLLLLTGSWFII